MPDEKVPLNQLLTDEDDLSASSSPAPVPSRRARRAAQETSAEVDAQDDGGADPDSNVRPDLVLSKEKTPRPKEKNTSVGSFMEIVEIFVGALIAAILVLTLICRTGVVKGTSMLPTMDPGDRYLITDLFYTPKQGDIVVFRPEIEGEEDLWIKRVIAMAGQTVYIDAETYEVYVDGKLLNEVYLSGNMTIPHTTENPITVPEGCVFVMGDNRSVSHDSRYSDLGCVEIGRLAGHVLFRFWPLNSFGACK